MKKKGNLNLNKVNVPEDLDIDSDKELDEVMEQAEGYSSQLWATYYKKKPPRHQMK